LNKVLERIQVPKIDPKFLTKILGKDRSIEQATRSEKRAASLGLHSFRHTNATAMDSLGILQQIRKQRLGHSGNSVTETTRTRSGRTSVQRQKSLGNFSVRIGRKGKREN